MADQQRVTPQRLESPGSRPRLLKLMFLLAGTNKIRTPYYQNCSRLQEGFTKTCSCLADRCGGADLKHLLLRRPGEGNRGQCQRFDASSLFRNGRRSSPVAGVLARTRLVL